MIIAKKRRWGVLQFLKTQDHIVRPEYWVLDDGFQHRSIARDHNILLLDAELPFGNGALLPLGTLREPVGALSRASLIVLTRAQESAKERDFLRGLATKTAAPIFLGIFATGWPRLVHRGKNGLTQLDRGSRVLALCGIAHPERYFRELVRQGLTIGEQLTVLDHEKFAREDIVAASIGCDAIVVNAKDYWRDSELYVGLEKSTFLVDLTLQFRDLAGKEASRLPI